MTELSQWTFVLKTSEEFIVKNTAWFGLEETIEIITLQSLYHRQRHLPLDPSRLALNTLPPGTGHLQSSLIPSFSGNVTSED